MKQTAKQRHIRQKNLNKIMCKNVMWHVIIILIMMIIASLMASKQIDIINNAEAELVNESQSIETIKPHALTLVTYKQKQEAKTCYPEFKYNKDWSENESYLLAKIAMAEAEGCSTQTKTLVIMCVLNRVESDKFPSTIEEVIFQKNQFSPIDNGRWDRVEPNEDCYEAVKVVMETKYDYSGGATYFENCVDEDNWHSRNLEFLYESEGIRFYK